jgi:hypothetical protein
LHSTGRLTQELIVDFIIHHVNAKGTSTPKVFKWTRLRLEADDHVELSKKRMIRHGSTRTHRSGRHRVELQVGGQILAESFFDVHGAWRRPAGCQRPSGTSLDH